MRRPKNLTSPPRGDWKYKQPETGMPFKESHPNALQAKVMQHRLALPELNMDVSQNWEVRLWDDVCAQNEHVECETIGDPGKFPGMGDVVNFIRSMIEWAKLGFSVVTEQEAERRAYICTSGANGLPCPNNKVIAACWGCHGIGDKIQDIIGHRKTTKDEQLQTCFACGGCVLRAKVWLPKDIIHVPEENLPSFCWQRSTETSPS